MIEGGARLCLPAQTWYNKLLETFYTSYVSPELRYSGIPFPHNDFLKYIDEKKTSPVYAVISSLALRMEL